ncbi:hypothetical protein FRC04_010522 [Tulasnella sp. 424]|nr:hypothetical protein FRC04_010522 [Tulasnella sp. 424]
MVDECSPAFIEAALASWMLRACVEYVPVERIGRHITTYSDSLSVADWKLVSLIVCILTKFRDSTDRIGVIPDSLRPYYSSPKRYDSSGDVEVIRVVQPPPTIQPFTHQIVISHNQPIYHSSPIYPAPTGHPIQPIIVSQPPTGVSIIHRQITGGPPQPIISERPGGDRLYMQGTGQSVPLAHTTSPIQYTPTGAAASIVVVEPQSTGLSITQDQITGGPPRSIISGGSVGDRLYMQTTGQTIPFQRIQSEQQPVFSPLRRFRSYTYPVHEVSIEANDMLNRSWPPILNIAELRSAYTRNVEMTLTALEEVAIDLARQRYAGDLDCHRILLNILRCAREITFDESRYPNTRVRDKLGLLDIAEQVLRIEDIPVQVRATATMLRMDCVTMLRLRFMTEGARRK